MNIFYGLDVVVKNSIDFEMIKVINYWKVKNKEEEEDENDIDVQIGIKIIRQNKGNLMDY